MCSTFHLRTFCFLAAIKTGRYTHEKKARDIEEVKKMKIDVSSVSILRLFAPNIPHESINVWNQRVK